MRPVACRFCLSPCNHPLQSKLFQLFPGGICLLIRANVFLDMTKNAGSMSACAFDLVLSNAPSNLWSTQDVASMLCVKPGAAAHMAGHLDLKVVLKSAGCAGAFASWLTRHARLLSSLQINSDRGWWPAWLSFQKCCYGHHGGVPAYRCAQQLQNRSPTAAALLVQLTAFVTVHLTCLDIHALVRNVLSSLSAASHATAV